MSVGKVVHREAFGSFPIEQRRLASRESLKLDNHVQYVEQGHSHPLERASLWREFEFELVIIQWNRMFVAISNAFSPNNKKLTQNGLGKRKMIISHDPEI